MITKDDMRKLMHSMEDFLKSKGFSDEEILGAIAVMKADTVASGIYKEESDKKEK
ncbi:MAG: hypothetical protein IJ717_13615 [Treponema sp.]|nr:hypothetical protein [Treponema sp.]